jgi:hypothetical protein
MVETPLTTWPIVLDEVETIKKANKGFNVARFGDGELKMIHGSGYVRQTGSIKMATELYETLTEPHSKCIVGIPTMDSRSPKWGNWSRHRERFMRVLSPSMTYYSAFISRPDSAPWIETTEFARSVEKLWRGKRTVVLCERKGSIFRAVSPAAGKAIHVECPFKQSYDIIDELEAKILERLPEFVVMSCGPSATCLANRLARRGVHAIDIGSAGQFLLRNFK